MANFVMSADVSSFNVDSGNYKVVLRPNRGRYDKVIFQPIN